MARVTVEDCIEVVGNRYELVLLAAQRARDIAAGAPITVDRDNDKNPVVALREIAEQTIGLDELRRHIAKGVNRQHDLNVEDDTLQTMAEQSLVLNGVDASAEITEVGFEDENVAEAEEAEAGVMEADSQEHSEDSDVEVVMDDLPSVAEIEKDLAATDTAPEVDIENEDDALSA